MGKDKKILLITGSMNQTSQMLGIARELEDYDCWFSQLFTDVPAIRYLKNNTGLLDKTVISNPYRQTAEDFLKAQNCRIDYEARLNSYDLVLFCSDLIVPSRLRNTKTIWVQEGMIDKANAFS